MTRHTRVELQGHTETTVPTFVGLGVLKAGTTLLHTWLAEHPEVCVPSDRKEVNFFSKYHDRGFQWYADLFEPTTERAVGEFSVSYLHSRLALERLTSRLPAVRCLVSLRDPVARIESQYRHFVMVGGYRGSCEDFIHDHPNARSRSLYAPQLRDLYEFAAVDRVKVMVFEEFTQRAEAEVRSLYRFVGVDEDFQPPSLHSTVNKTRVVRTPRLFAAKEAVSGYATRHDIRWLLRIGRRVRGDRLLLKPDQESPLPEGFTDAGARRLRAEFNDDIAETSELLGKDLAALWRRGRV